jgi:hypothetical protein
VVQVEWTQPFHWGLLLAYDQQGHFETPGLDRSGQVAATKTCLAVPVRHSQDVEFPEEAGPDDVLPWALVRVTVLVEEVLHVPQEFAGRLRCPSGRLIVGDAEQHRVVDVPAGDLSVQVARDAGQHAEHVSIAISAAAQHR